MPKPEVPSAADVATKWAEVTPGRSTYYEKNAVGKGGKWEANGKAAAPTYKSAVSAGDIDKRFSGGIKGKAGKFDRKVKEVGVSRFGPGVGAAKTDMETGVGPFLTEIAATEIAARRPRGDPGNYDGRSKPIGVALNKKRLALMAAGAA